MTKLEAYKALLDMVNPQVSSIGDYIALSTVKEKKDEFKEGMEYKDYVEVTRYSFGVFAGFVELVTVGKNTWAIDLINASASIEQVRSSIAYDKTKPELNGAWSDDTWGFIADAISHVGVAIGGSPGIGKTPFGMALSAAATALGLMVAICVSNDFKNLKETIDKLDNDLLENANIKLTDTKSIFETQHTEKYANDVDGIWAAVSPAVMFMTKLLTKNRGEDSSVLSEEFYKQLLVSIDGAAADSKWIIFNDAVKEGYALTNQLLQLFGYEKLSEMSTKENGFMEYSDALAKIYDKEIANSDKQYGFVSLVERLSSKLKERNKRSLADINWDEALKGEDAAAYKYALLKGNSFVITGIDYTTLHSDLDIFGEWTQEYIDARLEYLDLYFGYNIDDWEIRVAKYGENFYTDYELGEAGSFSPWAYQTGESGYYYTPQDTEEIVFGSSGGDKKINIDTHG